ANADGLTIDSEFLQRLDDRIVEGASRPPDVVDPFRDELRARSSEPNHLPVQREHAPDLLAVQAELREIACIRLKLVVAARVGRRYQHIDPVLLHQVANASPPSIPFGHAKAWKRALFSPCSHLVLP